MSPSTLLFLRDGPDGDSMASDLWYIVTHPRLVELVVELDGDIPIVTITVLDRSGGKSSANGPLRAIVAAYAGAMKQGGPFA